MTEILAASRKLALKILEVMGHALKLPVSNNIFYSISSLVVLLFEGFSFLCEKTSKFG